MGAAVTRYIADGALDAELAAVTWLLADGGVPLVVVSRDTDFGGSLRASLAALASGGRTTADGRSGTAGGVVRGEALEDVLKFSAAGGAGGAGGAGRAGGAHETAGEDASAVVSDAARDLGVVLIAGRDSTSTDLRVLRAHYVRPIERDAAGHIQRRPPALLSAWNGDAARVDHFFWAIIDELATRVGVEPHDFDIAYRRRARMLSDLVAAKVFDPADLRRHIHSAALVEAGEQVEQPTDAPN